VVVVVPPEARPEIARISAVPDCEPATNTATAMPLFVSASIGSTLPRVVVKRTVVPLGTGWPLFSRTTAVNCVVPPVGRVRLAAVSVIVEFVGASRAALLQPAPARNATATAGISTRASNREERARSRDIIGR
jgi:hypothetical protein